MEPIGLTFKRAGRDKYGKPRQGELMVVHRCRDKNCGKVSINRVAGDDSPEAILMIFEESQALDDNLRKEITKMGINLLIRDSEKEIRTQLFGKN